MACPQGKAVARAQPATPPSAACNGARPAAAPSPGAGPPGARPADHRNRHRSGTTGTLAWWIELGGLFLAYQAFELVRGRVVGEAGPAQRNARWVVDIERWTKTFHERGVNAFVDHHKTLAQAMDIYYGTIHFLIPPLVLIWLWRRHPGDYRRWRTVLAATTVASMAFFWLLPLAPPRLYLAPGAASAPAACAAPGTRFVDTDACYGGMGPLDRGNFKDANPYAAMPSLHVAWSTWCACAVFSGLGSARRRRRRWRSLAFLYPAWTLTVVVGTANHWFADAVGGWIVLAGAWLCVNRWMGRRDRGKEGRAHSRSGPDDLAGAVRA